MTAAKTKTTPPESAAAPEVWGYCPCPPGCGRERRVVDRDEGPAVVQHRRYSSWEREMVPCEGSGLAPAEAVAA